MRRFLILLTLLVPIALQAQQPNASQTRYQSKDTVKLLWNLDDSSGVKTTLLGQLIEWYLRNNDYGSTDGIKIQVLTPDGDSIRSGIWLSGDGKVSLFANHQTRLLAQQSGTQVFGNFTVSPVSGGTLPYIVLKNSLGDTTYLSISSTSKLIQLGTGYNLPNVSPATPQNGDVWRSGNVIKYRINNQTIGFDFTTTPVIGMGLRHNGTDYAPGYPDTGAVGGGGGSTRWDSIGNPGANKSFSMAAFTTTFSFGEAGAQIPWRFLKSAGSSSDYWMSYELSAGVLNNIVQWLNGGGNGVHILNNGTMESVGTGKIIADSIATGKLPAVVVLDNERNGFTATQFFRGDTTGPTLNIINPNANGAGLQSLASGSGYGVYGASSGSGTGGTFLSNTGIGLNTSTTSGSSIQRWSHGGTVKADATSAGFIPNTTGGYNLGSYSNHFGDAYFDSLFIGVSDIKKTWRGDGAYVYELHFDGTYTSSNTIIQTGIPTGKTWSYSWAVLNTPPVAFTPGFRVSNDTLYVTSTHLGMEGIGITINMFEQNF